MRINVKRKINAPTDALWSYIGDYSNIHRFHPLLTGSHFTEGNHACEVGSTRQCDMKGGDYIRERITEWKEGSHYSLDIYDTSMPVKDASATVGVRPMTDGASEAYMKMEMKAKYAVLTPFMYLGFRYFAAPGILKGLEKLYKEEHPNGIKISTVA